MLSVYDRRAESRLWRRAAMLQTFAREMGFSTDAETTPLKIACEALYSYEDIAWVLRREYLKKNGRFLPQRPFRFAWTELKLN
ncbi:hypothetical protein PQR67_22480 [Paraburkholderia fungorum]|uniref:hypothetical protein n=1 Tax=Paraburkholderia fungorum TaxID=134537 RepID=UPI0038B8928A